MTTALPEWFYPGPPGGWTADMLDHLPPEAPRHVQLIDGALVVRSPQTCFHMVTVRLFERHLRPPKDLVVLRGMTVTLGARQRPEADVLVVNEWAFTLATTSVSPTDVHLVVEVASDDSLERDRTTKRHSNTPRRASSTSGAWSRKVTSPWPTPSSSSPQS
ncbi:Uma2 family endonuclease [Nonomuraea sp. CA-141351]|uniref:Uma2 family endonuclease n=1 Tax=Nonomuraea sp. CA-141351 TaxID=3239996 RepID=UPI003D8ABB28